MICFRHRRGYKTYCCNLSDSCEECGTLPVGPEEVNQTHFANNRLAYSTWVVKWWMKGTRPEWIIVLSRVVEKTAKFNCLQKEWLLQHLKDRGFVKAWLQQSRG